ncbi:Hypothetical predicted protein, partial [Mytilus galloprovincialis]
MTAYLGFCFILICFTGLKYTEAAETCFPTVDCGFNVDGCFSFCVEKFCAGTARCVNNDQCCCGGCV